MVQTDVCVKRQLTTVMSSEDFAQFCHLKGSMELLEQVRQVKKLLEGFEDDHYKPAHSACVALLQQLPTIITDKENIMSVKERPKRGRPKMPPSVQPSTTHTKSSLDDCERDRNKRSCRNRTPKIQKDFVYNTEIVYGNSRSKEPTTVSLNKSKLKCIAPLKRGPKLKTPRVVIEKMNDLPNESLMSTSSKAAKRNKKGETALHSACTSQNVSKAIDLLNSDANPNTADNAGWTPLHEAVINNLAELVELLLKKNALPDVPGPMNDTPLHEAIKKGNLVIIKLLVEYGADVHMRNSKGVSPYDLAGEDVKKILTASTWSENHYKMHSMTAVLCGFNQDQIFNIYPSDLYTDTSSKLKNLEKHHPNLKIAKSIDKDVTHVLVNDLHCGLNLDTLTAVLFGVPVISIEWIINSDESELADWQRHEIIGLGPNSDCFRLSHMNRLKMYPPLFNGCHFYFHDLNTNYDINKDLYVNRQILTKLVVNGGGLVLKREPDPEAIPEAEALVPFHVGKNDTLAHCGHYIIYRKQPELAYNMKHIKSLPVGWLIECIQKFRLVNP
ncbi:uncharacterized protein LOC143916497 [Arctopsyche grandis]|uniref:uncharacterized protein LOC143916497 n=1 Tax=Arctopsyche grandis TaxID=121162 RepID=UPI00406D6CA5